jgi:2-isopropylmalate synthase
MSTVLLYDTTLRDGSQRENLSFSCNDKLRIVKRLDRFGMHYIEGGWPGSNPKDIELFERARSLHLVHARLAAFGATRRKGTACELDANLQALLAAETPVVTIVGKSWDLHVEKVLETTREENLAMIADSVRYLKGHGREVVYDAEHLFDGYLADHDYALQTVRSAAEAGADFVVLCDTNGGSLPWQVAEIAGEIGCHVTVPLGIHAHDDAGCGVANSLAAVTAGCVMVQGTINGYGERVANANLSTIVPDLQVKMGYSCVSDRQLQSLTELARFVAETANIEPDPYAPFVGRSAFTHKGGIHVAAMLKEPESYQHVDPAQVGNTMRSLVSELSGRGNLVHLASRAGVSTDRRLTGEVLESIKALEHRGYAFEGAEATVELMFRRAAGDYQPPFELVDFMVVVERRQGRGLVTEATVKVRIGEELFHTVAEGNGPVNALDRALGRALRSTYPELEQVQLTDYKVRILDSETGTAATTRVLADFQQGSRSWSTVGASTNIIEASWQALAESMEYALLDQMTDHLQDSSSNISSKTA